MALRYAEAKSQRNDVSVDLRRIVEALRDIQGRASAQHAKAASLPSTYASLASGIDALATANPNDQVIQSLKAEKDKLDSEFVTIRNLCESMKTAVEAIQV